MKKDITLENIEIKGEVFQKMSNVDAMRPFFMSIVSDSDHWMFVSSNGGLSAGRKNPDYALFPYSTDDKITDSAEFTGSKSIFRIRKHNQTFLWEPFSDRMSGRYQVSRNLYKSIHHNKIIFEEINKDLELRFRYEWNFSDRFGFVRKSSLLNLSAEKAGATILDGIQNILPYGVGSDLQRNASNLVNAYKRNELHPENGMGIFALSAIIVDKAEPSEALKANIAWSLGFDNPTFLLSSLQLDRFRDGGTVQQETDIKGEKGAYFISGEMELGAQEEKTWMIIANVNQTQSAIISLSEEIQHHANLTQLVLDDIERGTKNLLELNAAADAIQCTADELKDTRHFSNVLFNIMRGGIFDCNYQAEKWDFENYLKKANKGVYTANKAYVDPLPGTFSVQTLKEILDKSGDEDFRRLATEYLPLKFSRRHGDPSRPWNQFSINMKNELDGSKILDYQGNWRDIFQNWEALAHAYPEFIEGMIFKFLNASTFDGYNPYRVTKDGFDWETIEPDNPWSYIGYWGDHQVIYLLKFLEFIENHQPGALGNFLDKARFVYANVPYRIKSYEEILKNPKDTIVFDHASDTNIREKCARVGADGALLGSAIHDIHHVNFLEKILAVALSKLSNFIPEGGIWMNTQRPEWNDANNALVGNGVSMVTLYYLRRFFAFLEKLLSSADQPHVDISTEMADFFSQVSTTLEKFAPLLSRQIEDTERKSVMDALGQAGSRFRNLVYDKGFSGKKSPVSLTDLRQFAETTIRHLDHAIRANKRADHLYHAYNLVTIDKDAARISRLSEMLEGQVAVLSSGMLSSEASLQVLDALEKSSLFRKDQSSYILYPNKDLPGFLQKNIIPKAAVEQSVLLRTLVAEQNVMIIEQDVRGNFHFNGNFKNANDLEAALDKLPNPGHQQLAAREKSLILGIFETVFNHKEFTGRSGTFYGYEGLGSIYWHMVSKLQLAAAESCLKALRDGTGKAATGRLIEHYYNINEGIGVHKSPETYGAFPTDPYSHTPMGKGAQQPGMTGQVKEDILSRFGELGVFVHDGQLSFEPVMLKKSEFLEKPRTVRYVDVFSKHHSLALDKGTLFFTYCQVPILYKLGGSNRTDVHFANGRTEQHERTMLGVETSRQVFQRTGEITMIVVYVNESALNA